MSDNGDEVVDQLVQMREKQAVDEDEERQSRSFDEAEFSQMRKKPAVDEDDEERQIRSSAEYHFDKMKKAKKLEECNERVNSKKETTETCQKEGEEKRRPEVIKQASKN